MERIAGSGVLAPKDVQRGDIVDRGAIEEQLALDKASKDPRRIAATVWCLADAHLKAGERDDALANYRRAVGILHGSAERGDLAASLYELAEVERAVGDDSSAQDHYAAAEKGFAEAGDAAAAATCGLMLADARWRTNRRREALDAYERARATFDEAGDELGQAHVFFQRAMRYLPDDKSAAAADLERARNLYTLVDKRINPNPGIRISNPTLPGSVSCVRSVEPYLMAKLCERDLEVLKRPEKVETPEKLETPFMPPPADGPAASEAVVVAPPTEAGHYGSAAGVLVGVLSAFALLALVVSGQFRPSVQVGQFAGLLLGGCAAGVTSFGLRWLGASSQGRIRIGAPIVAMISVYAVTSILMGNRVESSPSAPGGPMASVESDAEPVAQGEQAASLRARAKAAAARGDFVEAATLYQEALVLYLALGDAPGQAAVLDAMARLRHDGGHPEEARELHEQALAAYFRAGDAEAQIRSAVAIVAIDEAAADVDRLMGSLAVQLRLYEDRDDRGGQIETLARIVDLQQGLANPNAALEAMKPLLALYEGDADVGRFASALEGAARLDKEAGNQDTARARLNRAYVLHRNGKDDEGMARTLNALGGLDLAEGELSRASASFAEALKLTGDAEGDVFTTALLGLGDAEGALGNSERATESYREALRICTRTSQLPCQARSLLRLGAIDEELRRPDSARASYEGAGDLFGRAGELLEHAKVMARLAVFESRTGNDASAAAHALTSIQLASRLEVPRQRAAGLVASADAAAVAGDPEVAGKAYLEALKLYESWGDEVAKAEVLRKLQSAGIGEGDVYASNPEALEAGEAPMPSRQ